MTACFRPAMLTAAALMLAAASPALGQLGRGDLFSNSLDTIGDAASFTQNFHDERFAPNHVSSDRSALFAADYSTATTTPAPGTATTTGLVAFVNSADNVSGDTPERVALNFAPNVSIDSAATDWVMTVNAFAFNLDSGTTNTTLSYLAGMSTTGTRANWQGGADTDGVFWSLSTTGQATADLLSFQGNPGSPASSFQPHDINGNPINTDRPTPGTAGDWVTLAVGSHSNTPFFAIRSHQADGTPNAWEVLESFDNTTGATVGTPFFGVEDPFNSANGNIGVVFDNVSVQTLRQGDTNFDGDVDFHDAIALRRAFSGSNTAADGAGAVAPGFDADLWLWTLGDFDQDRDVDFDDALKVVANYDARTNSTTFDAPTNPLTLEVNTQTGNLTVTGEDTQLTGIQITSDGGSLAGSDANFGLTFAADAQSFAALSIEGVDLNDGSRPLGLQYQLGGDRDLAFSYGVGDESFTGQVRYIPEPSSVALILGSLLAFGRARRSQR